MTREEITGKVKEYCAYELKNAGRHGWNPREATTRAYGAVMFVINMGDFDSELSSWWDDEMLPKFRALEMEV